MAPENHLLGLGYIERVSRNGAVDKLQNLDFSTEIWYNKRKTGVNVC